MSFLDRVEHHTYINVCVELGKSLLEIKQLLEKTQRGSSVSRALVNRWHIHVKKIPRPHLAKKMTERHTVITESLKLNMLNSHKDGACQTMRGNAKQHPSSNCT